MTGSDDHNWFEALAGRKPGVPEAGGADARAARAEGNMLRSALREMHLHAPRATEDTGTDAAREESLIARAVREGLIERPVPATFAAGRPARLPQHRHRRFEGWRPLLAAAALAFLGVGIAWMVRGPGDAEVVRGAVDGVVRLEAVDPVELQQRVLTGLRGAGVEATGYEALGVYGIDADLPRPLPAAVAQLLESHGIPAPADGVLRVEIRERP